MPHTTLFSFSLCTLLATAAVAQTPAPKVAKADARAEARAKADAKSSDSSHSSHTVTHRVVVENGRTVVDERTENGSPVPAGGPGPAGVPPLPAIDADEMLRKLREQVEREVGGGLPPIPVGGQPLDGRRASDRASDTASNTSKQNGSSPGTNSKDASTKGSSGKVSRTPPTAPRPTGERGKLPPRTDHR